MPKEKATRKTKAKAASDGGKKKKGKNSRVFPLNRPDIVLTHDHRP